MRTLNGCIRFCMARLRTCACGWRNRLWELDSTYITLISTKTVRILNTSDIPVHFKWVSFRNEDQDAAEKRRLEDELNALEEEECKALETKEYDLGSVPQTENPDEARQLLYHADLEAISKKFNHLRMTLNEDSLIFSDENFSIEPKEGSIWAQSSIEVTLTFQASDCSRFQVDRLPLCKRKGLATTPSTVWSGTWAKSSICFYTHRHRRSVHGINP